MAFRIQIRRDTSSKWSINNPVLLQGELGFETDTDVLKIGDGVNPWNDLGALVTGTGVLPLNVFSGDLTNEIVHGATGILFNGTGITGSGTSGIATITITGGDGSSTSGTSGISGNPVAVFDEGTTKTTGATGINFTGLGVTVINDGDFATVTIPGATSGNTKVYGFKFNYGGGNATGLGSREPIDISTVTQITSSPFVSTSATVTIPGGLGDNLINFTFGSETSPFVNAYIMSYDATNDRYLWGDIDSLQRDLLAPDYEHRITGLTLSSSGTAVSGNYYSDTNILTSFSSASFQILLSQAQTGAVNLSLGAGKYLFAHGYIFFVFPV